MDCPTCFPSASRPAPSMRASRWPSGAMRVSEPVLTIDPGAQGELHLPASHNREITSSRRPIRRDNIVEELPRTTSREGNAEKRTGFRSHQSQARMAPTRNATSPRDETPRSFALGASRRRDSTLSRRVMKSPHGSPPHDAL